MKVIMWLVHFIEVLVIETEIKCGYICNGKESVKPKLASPLYSFMMRFFMYFQRFDGTSKFSFYTHFTMPICSTCAIV